jgi:hypothetical protein
MDFVDFSRGLGQFLELSFLVERSFFEDLAEEPKRL